jgi:transcriptional regulator with XRE-family HTH domain
MTLSEALASEIRDRAHQRGMRARQVAGALDLAEISYSHRLRGEIDWRMDELERIAALFDVNLDELFACARERRSDAA